MAFANSFSSHRPAQRWVLLILAKAFFLMLSGTVNATQKSAAPSHIGGSSIPKWYPNKDAKIFSQAGNDSGYGALAEAGQNLNLNSGHPDDNLFNEALDQYVSVLQSTFGNNPKEHIPLVQVAENMLAVEMDVGLQRIIKQVDGQTPSGRTAIPIESVGGSYGDERALDQQAGERSEKILLALKEKFGSRFDHQLERIKNTGTFLDPECQRKRDSIKVDHQEQLGPQSSIFQSCLKSYKDIETKMPGLKKTLRDITQGSQRGSFDEPNAKSEFHGDGFGRTALGGAQGFDDEVTKSQCALNQREDLIKNVTQTWKGSAYSYRGGPDITSEAKSCDSIVMGWTNSGKGLIIRVVENKRGISEGEWGAFLQVLKDKGVNLDPSIIIPPLQEPRGPALNQAQAGVRPKSIKPIKTIAGKSLAQTQKAKTKKGPQQTAMIEIGVDGSPILEAQ